MLPSRKESPVADGSKLGPGCLTVVATVGLLAVVGWLTRPAQPTATPTTTSTPQASSNGVSPLTKISQSAPVQSAAPDKWVGGRQTASAMDDSPTVVFQLEAENRVANWLGSAKPTLTVRCKEHQTEVYVITDSAAAVEYDLDGATVRTRWDDEPAKSSVWSKSTDDKALFAPSAVAFIRKLPHARTLRVQYTPFNASPVIAEFDVRGFGDRIKDLAAACGWKP